MDAPDSRDTVDAAASNKGVLHCSLAAAGHVDIDVGPDRSIGVEEPLEQKAILDWVSRGDAECVVRKGAASRAPVRSHEAHRLGRMDVLPDEEEVVCPTTGLDEFELSRQPFRVPWLNRSTPLLESALAEMSEVVTGRAEAVGHINRRPDRFPLKHHVASLGDLDCVRQGLRHSLPESSHLAAGLHVALVPSVVRRGLLTVTGALRPNRANDAVRLCVVLVQESTVVRGHDRDPEAATQALFVRQPMALDFEEHLAPVKHVSESHRRRLTWRTKEADQAITPVGQVREADCHWPRCFPLTARRADLDEVPPPTHVFGKEHDGRVRRDPG